STLRTGRAPLALRPAGRPASRPQTSQWSCPVPPMAGRCREQASRFQPEPLPGSARPQSRADRLLGLQESAVAGAGLSRQLSRRTVLYYPTSLDDQHALEVLGLANIMGDA